MHGQYRAGGLAAARRAAILAAMEWQDEGVVLAMRRHGESGAILQVFTAAHGRHAGVVRGGGTARLSAMLQPGTQLRLTWRARLSEHIGSFRPEPLHARAPALLGDRLGLAGLNAVCALLAFSLPEREPQARLYARSLVLLDGLGRLPDWPLSYLHWEMALLEEMGFGLDLSRCALSGTTDDLAYVSPRSGRAVARAAAGDWAPRLLPMPACMLGQGPATPEEVVAGLAVTGHFLAHHLAPALGDRPLPAARARLVALLAQGAAAGTEWGRPSGAPRDR